MSVRRIATIYLKELREICRSSGLIFVMIVLPAVVYPLMIFYTGETTEGEKSRLDAAVCPVSVVGAKLLPGLRECLAEDELISVVEGERDGVGEDCRLVVRVERQPDLFASGYSNFSVSLLYDSTDKYSRRALERVAPLIDDFRRELTYERLDRAGVSPDAVEPIRISRANVATNEKITGSLMGDLIPFVLIIFVISGSMQISVDITAGEKDRKTIQTLLMTPAKRSEIALAKIMVSATAAFVCCSVNLLSIAGAFCLLPSSAGLLKGFSVSLQSILACLAVLLPFVLFVSSLLVALGFAAKNQVEAGIFTMPVVVGGMAGAISASSADLSSLGIAQAFVPVYGTALSVKMIFMSQCSLAFILSGIAANLAFALALGFAAARLFSSESIAFSGVSDLVVSFLRAGSAGKAEDGGGDAEPSGHEPVLKGGGRRQK